MSNVTVQKALKNALFTIRCYRAEITLDKKRPNDLIEVDLVISEIEAALSEMEKCEPFVYLKAEPFGWTYCDETDEGAIALYEAPTVQQSEPFGYFKAEPFGWTDFAETDEGAIALYEAPTVQREGWVSVPIEPTWEMTNNASENTDVNSFIDINNVWQAMIQAAPTDKG